MSYAGELRRTAKQVNHPTTARVPGGALVERSVDFELKDIHMVGVVLNDADFHTAERMALAINRMLGGGRARAVDSRRVELSRMTQIVVAVRTRNDGPVTVHSRPGAPSALPRARLPSRNERSSIAPDGGTPTSQRCSRPGQS